MATRPTFFFSHARKDRELSGLYMRQFYEDLCARVAAAAGYYGEDGPLGTIDDVIDLGNDWEVALGEPLAVGKALVAVYSPLYFERPHCGREFATFVLRSPGLGIDREGQLTGVANVLPIRWFEPGFYAANNVANGRIPKLLRRITDVLPMPANSRLDRLRAEAIQYYRDYGMEMSVNVQPHYKLLLNSLALVIHNLPALPHGAVRNWSQMIDAFRHDWFAQFNVQAVVQPPIADALFTEPRPVNDFAVFYLTNRPYEAEAAVVSFADRLLVEPSAGQNSDTDPRVAALITDIREACQSQGLHAIHCGFHSSIPPAASGAIDRLRVLSQRHVMVALVVDPALLLGPTLAVVREIVDDESWYGPVLVPDFTAFGAGAAKMIDARRRPVYCLAEQSDQRRDMLIRILLELRQLVTARATATQVVQAEAIPLLSATGARTA